MSNDRRRNNYAACQMRIVAAILERSKPNWFKRKYLSLRNHRSEYEIMRAVMDPNNLEELRISYTYYEAYKTTVPLHITELSSKVHAGNLNSGEVFAWVIYVYFTCKRFVRYEKLSIMIADDIEARRREIALILNVAGRPSGTNLVFMEDAVRPSGNILLRYLDWA